MTTADVTRYRPTAADITYGERADLIKARLPETDRHLLDELDDAVGVRLGEHEEKGYRLARMMLVALDYDQACELAGDLE